MTATMVQVDIHMVGLCHTDIHMKNNDWGTTDYPLLAGHEGVGTVTHAGSAVRTVSVGDRVGISWIRDSCQKCAHCQEGRENICMNGYQGTYLGKSCGIWGSKNGQYNEHGGCFARVQRVEEKFAILIPEGLPDEAVCPLLCGGGTVYEPLCNHASVGSRVGIMGLGGLGRCGLKLAKLRACYVVIISTSSEKRESALQAGADEFWCVSEDDLSDKGKLDLIIDTRPVNAPVADGMKLLGLNGTYCRVGLPPADDQDYSMQWIGQVMQQQSVTGSVLTGSKRLNEVVQTTAEHKDFILDGDDEMAIEVVPFEKINDVMTKLLKGENTCFRYVLKW